MTTPYNAQTQKRNKAEQKKDATSIEKGTELLKTRRIRRKNFQEMDEEEPKQTSGTDRRTDRKWFKDFWLQPGTTGPRKYHN